MSHDLSRSRYETCALRLKDITSWPTALIRDLIALVAGWTSLKGRGIVLERSMVTLLGEVTAKSPKEVALLESTEERNSLGLLYCVGPSYFLELRRPPAPPVDVLSSWNFALEDVSRSGRFFGDGVNGPVCGKATESLCEVGETSNGTAALGVG